MAPKIPKSFGAVKSDKQANEAKGDGARSKKNIPKLPIPQSSPNSKRKYIVDLTVDTNRQKKEDAPVPIPSLARNQLGPLASVFVKDEEVRE